MAGRLVIAVLLCGVYLAILGSTDPLDVAAGLVIGLLLVVVLRPTRADELPVIPDERRPPAPGRVLGFPWLVAGVLAEVVAGSWDVALRVLGVRSVEHAGEVRMPIGERTPVGVAVSALCFAYAPGGMVVEIDEEARELVLHVMDARDPAAVVADRERFYERYQRRVFP